MAENEIELLLGLHKDAQRQGPGSPVETKKALDLIGLDRNKRIKIADIGCGSGAQTITLAENTNADIVAVDLFPAFLEKLKARVRELNLEERITTLVHPMENLPFLDNEFDLLWSEGAIYNMGFEEGVKQWKRFIKPDGYLAVSEISWITDKRPKEVEEHWLKEYPQIDTVSNKIKILEKHGYSPAAHFILPEYCWIDNYYRPLQERFSSFLHKYGNCDLAKEIVEKEKEEICIYEKYKEYYSYGFYIAQKKIT